MINVLINVGVEQYTEKIQIMLCQKCMNIRRMESNLAERGFRNKLKVSLFELLQFYSRIIRVIN